MTPTDTTALTEILNCSHYDQRTDYIWQFITNNLKDRRRGYFRIPSLEAFVAMGEMLKCRKLDIPTFMDEWEQTEHPGLLECSYNERSGIVRLKSRTFTFVYRSKTNEYHYTAFAAVARSCMLKSRETHKKYVKGGLFPIAHLVELDEQLYSRYAAAQKLEAWKKSPQAKLDIEYCRQMVPTIMQEADTRKRQMHMWERLNIILEGNDRVRIGLVEMYSPEEMIAMPSYPREEWQQGILKAFDQLSNRYREEMEQKRAEMTQLSEELTQVTLGKTPYDAENLQRHYEDEVWRHAYVRQLLYDALGKELQPEKWEHQKEFFQPYITFLAGNSRSPRVHRFEAETFIYEADTTGHDATITIREEALAKMLNVDRTSKIGNTSSISITAEMLTEYDGYIKQKYREFTLCQQRQQRPQHAQMVRMLRHIIEVTAPLIAYTGENATLRDNYKLKWGVEDDDSIMLQANFRDRSERQYFSTADYTSRFRVWWSQLLLKECKLAKEASLNPEAHLSPGSPF